METETLNGLPFPYKIKGDSGNWRIRDVPITTANADPMPLECIPFQHLQNFLQAVGYKKILSFSILELDPKSCIPTHIDDHPTSKNLSYITGAKKLYFSYNICKNIYFKLGDAGILPLENPILINTAKHVHAVVNNSNAVRKVLMVYGILDKQSESCSVSNADAM